MTGLSLFLGFTPDNLTPVSEFESSSRIRLKYVGTARNGDYAFSPLAFGSRTDRSYFGNQAAEKATGFHDQF